MKSLKIQLPVNKCIKSSSVIIHTQRTISQSQKKLSYQKKKKKKTLYHQDSTWNNSFTSRVLLNSVTDSKNKTNKQKKRGYQMVFPPKGKV